MIEINEVIQRLQLLAERMPRPYDEDRAYSPREIDELNYDLETVKSAIGHLLRGIA